VAYARFLSVLAEEDHTEGGAREHLDGAQGVAEAMVVAAALEGRRAGRWSGPGGGWGEGRCAHVSIVDFGRSIDIGLRA
jgi:hypothetical protein